MSASEGRAFVPRNGGLLFASEGRSCVPRDDGGLLFAASVGRAFVPRNGGLCGGKSAVVRGKW